MRTLHLLRHAKPSWDDPSLDDVERPLGPAYSGPRRRAGTHRRAVRIERDIYEATVRQLCALVRGLPTELRSVLLVGDDPAFHVLATSLADAGDDEILLALRAKYPTGALASLDFDVDWTSIEAGCGRLVSFVRPRALTR